MGVPWERQKLLNAKDAKVKASFAKENEKPERNVRKIQEELFVMTI